MSFKKINFTDGTYITFLCGQDDRISSGVTHAFAFPYGAIVLHPINGLADGSYTKTDSNRNTWSFTQGADYSDVKINGNTVFRADGYAIFAPRGYISNNNLYIGHIRNIGGSNNAEPYNYPSTQTDASIYGWRATTYSSLCINSVGVGGSFYDVFNLNRAQADSVTGWYGNGVAVASDYKTINNNVLGNLVVSIYTPVKTPALEDFPYYSAFEFTPNSNSEYGGIKVFTNPYNLGSADNYDDFDPESPSTDPYQDGGESGTGGGDGTFTGDNDPVDIPALPTVGAQDAGFISLFAPTIAQLKNLASFMWSDLFDIDTFKKIFNDPMDSILGLSVVPVDVPTSGAREITVGNIVTTVSMNVASQQYIEVDCGSVDFTSKYFGSYLDYEPYTKISIYVPYSGYHDLRTDDIMGRVVRMVYHIDILTGSLVAFLKCGDSVLYEFNGACASNIPVTNISYNSTIENAMRIAVNIGTTVATAGASAPLSASGAINMVGSTAEGALSMKPSVGRSGSMGGTTGIMGNQIPYFIVTRPRACIPNRQNHYQGYPSFITYNIGALAGKGFTAFENILLKDLYLTDGEKSELESILKEGIYL